MQKPIVVNGEPDWQTYFPGLEVYHQGHLWVFDSSETLKVEQVLWRVGAIKPHPSHRTV